MEIDNIVLRRAIQKWGWEAQFIVAIEELAELQKALCKYFRYIDMPDDARNDIINEVADVYIMLEQIKESFSGDVENEIQYRIDQKMKRLKARLDNSEVVR